jgi:phosphocarrier protein
MVAERQFVVRNELGIHARAASRFAQIASRYAAEIEVERAGIRANGKSVIGLLMIVASQGSTILVRGKGPDAPDALEALASLVDRGFDER